MLPHIQRIDPTVLKPEPIKTNRDRNQGKRKGEEAPEHKTPTPEDEMDTPDVDESPHVIDVRI